MSYVVVALYKPGQDLIKAAYAAGHVEHFVRNLHHVLVGGQLRSDDGVTPLGGMMVLDYDKIEDVRSFLADDPYHQQGVFGSVSIQRIHVQIPEKEPGELLRLARP